MDVKQQNNNNNKQVQRLIGYNFLGSNAAILIVGPFSIRANSGRNDFARLGTNSPFQGRLHWSLQTLELSTKSCAMYFEYNIDLSLP